MRQGLAAVCLAAVTLVVGRGAAAQQQRQTIFLPKMDGFERNVAGALKNPGVVVDESKADLKGEFTPAGSRSGIAAIFQEKSGRYPEDILDVKQADGRRTL